ncbi:hypothetical protein BDQ17DRAFT_1433967 [Cyathus striatus]|nr:hypothetical protein BDQ17DRAFT_1433967 [Cyathus striatus]
MASPSRNRSLIFNSPDENVDPEGWNAFWEKQTRDEAMNRRVIDDMLGQDAKHMEILATESRTGLRFVLNLQRRIADYVDINLFEHGWKLYSSSERRNHMLEGLVRSSINFPEVEILRALCSEITIEALEKEEGSLFVNLLKFYKVTDSSKLTPETRRSYPHPKWADEMKREHEKDSGSMRAVMWEIIQLQRDVYICNFLSETLKSCMGAPPPPPPVVINRCLEGRREYYIKNKPSVKNYERNLTMKKSVINELMQQWKDGITGAAHRKCLSCGDAWKVFNGKTCQKDDWLIHKTICGKRLTPETTKNIFTPQHSITPEQHIPPAKVVTHSPTLEHQISLLSDPVNANVGYFLFAPSGNRYSVYFHDDATLRMVFDDIRYAAIMKSDKVCIALLTQHLICHGLYMTGAKDMTEHDIISQLQSEFPSIPIASIATRFDNIEDIPKGRTALEYEGERLQGFWDEEFLKPENGLIVDLRSFLFIMYVLQYMALSLPVSHGLV